MTMSLLTSAERSRAERTSWNYLRSLSRRTGFNWGKDDWEDLEQESRLFPVLAEKEWRADGGRAWNSWLLQTIRWEASKTLRKYRRYRDRHRAAELDAPLGEESTTTLGALIPDSDPWIYRAELTDLVRHLLSTLPEKQVRILHELYWEEKPQKQVAAELGVSAPAVGQMERRALASLRRAFLALDEEVGPVH